MARSLAAAYLVVGVLVGAACGGGSRHAAPPPEPIANRQPAPEKHSDSDGRAASSDQALAMLNAFTEQMCGCTDLQCARTVADRLTAWTQDQATRLKEPVEMTEGEQKVYQQLGMRMGDCMQRAMANGASASPPPPSP